MKKIYLIIIAVVVTTTAFCQSHLNLFSDWSATDGTQYFFLKSITKLDAKGNVYVAGATMNGTGNYDLLVSKYDKSGVQQWIQQIDNGGMDVATAIFVTDTAVYVTGVSTNSSADVITCKMDASTGSIVWSAYYDGGYYDAGADIAEDDSSYIYITGGSFNGSGDSDFLIVKYDNVGHELWSKIYSDTLYGLNEVANKLTMDGGNVIISGVVQANSTTYRYGVASYNKTSGGFNSVKYSTGGITGMNQVGDMKTDAVGNIYICGAINNLSLPNHDYCVIKLDTALNITWTQTYDNGMDDVATGLVVDNSGDVYVTGYSTSSTQGKNWTTIKYNALGTQQWLKVYNDSLNLDDVASAVIKDALGNIYVTGSKTTSTNNTDYYTVKYDGSGNVKGYISSDGTNHLNDNATNIAMDNTGNIIVTGQSQTGTGTYEYKTVRYIVNEKIPDWTTLPTVNDAYGNPMNPEGMLIVRFLPMVLKMDRINDMGLVCSQASSFISDSMIYAMGQKIFTGTSDERAAAMGNVITQKIFPWMTSHDSISITRSGEKMRVPNFWATLMFYFHGLDEVIIHDSLKTLFPGVIYSHPDYLAHYDSAPNDSLWGEQASLAPTATYPNGDINIDSAWCIIDSTWAHQTGKPRIKVGVVDSGIDSLHPDLDVFRRVDFSIGNGNGDPAYAGSHGTPVAGIIGAKRNNTIGIAGIAGETGIASDSTARIFDLDGGDPNSAILSFGNLLPAIILGASDIYTTVNYVGVPLSKGYGLNVMNTSWGGAIYLDYIGADTNVFPFFPTPCNLCHEASEYTFRNGCSLVASRGNHGASSSFPLNFRYYPSCEKDEMVISVGACGYNGAYKVDSNGVGGASGIGINNDSYRSMVGRNLDLIAPGTRATVRTTAEFSFSGNDKYGDFNGTSASAPHVTGVVALMMSEVNSPCPSEKNLSPEDVEHILQITAKDRDDGYWSFPGYDDATGYGLLDATKAMKAIEEPKYQIIHVKNTGTPTVTLYETDTVVLLVSPYELPGSGLGPYSNTFWGVPDGAYYVDIYKVTSSYNYSNDLDSAGLHPNTQILGECFRNSASTGWGLHDASFEWGAGNWVWDTMDVTTNTFLDSTGLNTVDISSYFYKFKYRLSDSLFVNNQWFPDSTSHFKSEFSVYVYDDSATTVHTYPCYTGLGVHDVNKKPSGLGITNVYPNPSTELINIEYNLEENDNASINVVNLLGEKVYSVPIAFKRKGNYKSTIDVSNYCNGIYFVSLNTKRSVSLKKFVILK